MDRPGPVGARATTGLWLEWERAGIHSRLPLDRPLTIGRDPASDICLAEATVSRRHALVSLVAGQPFVDASASTNGIELDRGRANRVALGLGQTFRIDGAIFRVVQAPVVQAADGSQPMAPVGPVVRPPRTPRPIDASGRSALGAVAAIALVVVVLGGVLGLAVLGSFGSAASSAAPATWVVASEAVPSDAPPEMVSAIQSFQPPRPVLGSGFVVETVQIDGDWAVATGHAVAGPSDLNTPTETIVVIAHRTASGWQTISDRDDGFCATLKQLPQSLMDDTERAYYVGCN